MRSFGENFRLLFSSRPSPSPCAAMNEAARRARSPLLAIMLDGAYILSPRVVATCLDAYAAYPDAIVTVPRFYLGPGQQGSTIALGYDREVEDQMLDFSGWQKDGYNLFHYSSVIGHHRNMSVLGTPFESSFLLLASDLYAEVGGFDERFDEPGGGFGNIDFFEQIAARPGTYVGLLGEGIFHQVHGGPTTNVSRCYTAGKSGPLPLSATKRFECGHGKSRRLFPRFMERLQFGRSVAPHRTGINEETLHSLRKFLDL